MENLSLKNALLKTSEMSTLRSDDSSFAKRKQIKERPEYKSLGLIMDKLRKAGMKVNWKKPLSKDIYREIRLQLPVDFISGRKLYQAIGYHVRSVKYLLKMRPGVSRLNIHGEKIGVVTELESKYALHQLLSHHSEFMKDRRKKQKKKIFVKKRAGI